MANVDKKLIRSRFARHFETYNRQAIVQRQVATRLACILQKYAPIRLNRIFEVGCGTGFLTQQITAQFSFEDYYLNDLVGPSIQKTTDFTGRNNYNFISGDAEEIGFPDRLDAIISASTYQWFKDIEGYFVKARKVLKQDGLFAFSTYGKKNFDEIRTTLNIGLDYYSLDELTQMLKPGFNIMHTEEWIQHEQFSHPVNVLRHIQQTGVNSLQEKKFTKSLLREFEDGYRNLYSDADGAVRLTYHPIIIIAKLK